MALLSRRKGRIRIGRKRFLVKGLFCCAAWHSGPASRLLRHDPGAVARLGVVPSQLPDGGVSAGGIQDGLRFPDALVRARR